MRKNGKRALIILQSLLMIIVIVVLSVMIVKIQDQRNVYRELAFRAGNAYEQARATPVTIDNFLLSNAPGVFNFEFYLYVRHVNPNAIIVFTTDGSYPSKSSSRIGAEERIRVRDRSVGIGAATLSRHTQSYSDGRGRPARGADIPVGNTFRFAAFVDGIQLGDAITASYIIWHNFGRQFDSVPVISITAEYEKFVELYWDNVRSSNPVRHIMHYEFFEHNVTTNRYERKFDMYGSTQLGGGRGARARPQRVFNVHMARGDLDGHITHPVFAGLYDLTRFRLWNSSNNFWRCMMREPFTQTAMHLASPYIIHSDYRLAMKFINGEFWGMTHIREHTSNNFFTSARMGIEPRNRAAIIDFSDIWGPMAIDIQEAAGGYTQILYDELRDFVTGHDLSQEENMIRLFDEFFCLYNMIDYIITRTFFDTAGWFDNTRIARAVHPDLGSGNQNMDGRWRFILNDFDGAIRDNHYRGNRFSAALYLTPRHQDMVTTIMYAELFKNAIFVQRFVDRAEYLMQNGLSEQNLVELFQYMRAERLVLLPAHYARFSMTRSRSVASSIDHFESYMNVIYRFARNRHAYYRQQLEYLLGRVGL